MSSFSLLRFCLLSRVGDLHRKIWRAAFQRARRETLAIVCGTDGFLANVCGQDSEHPSGFLSNVGYTNVVKCNQVAGCLRSF